MKNFAFDLYGTLIDIQTDEDDPAFREGISREFFALCGGECDFWKDYKALCAPPPGDMYYEPDLLLVFSALAKKCGAGLGRRQLEEFAYRFRIASRKKLCLYPEVDKMLCALKESGAKIYLLSNAQACFTNREMEELSLTKYFDGICLSSDAGVKKPSERFFNLLLKKFGLEREDTVYTGNDYYSDVLGAKGVGLYSAYIRTYNEAPLDEVKRVADFVAEDFKTLKEKLITLAKER